MDNIYQTWLWEKWAEKTVKTLKGHDFDARFVSDVEEARKLILEMVSDYETIGFGGSHTTRSIGILEELKAKGKTIFDHWVGDIFSDENLNIRREQGRCDCFFCSANAISATGEIVNVDAAGNRNNAMTFGPKKVIIVAGMNKVRSDLDSAIKRVKEIAAPMRAQSLNMDTPCAKTGLCNDCDSPQRICRVTTILHRRPMMSDITVVLINETLGF